jgi:RNA polymerase sigma-70 factor (sigma-E family)
VQEADEREYAAYVAARLVPLRRLGFLVCGDWHLAEDAVATALAKLYSSWTDVRRAESVDAYVRRMVLSAITDEYRRPWRKRERPTERLAEPRFTGHDRADDRMVLEEALRRMPPRRRAVLVLRFFEGLSVEETAAAMGSGTGTVKSQTARGLAALRELLPADYLTTDGGSW